MNAVVQGNAETIPDLIKEGANPNAHHGGLGWTPLHAACGMGKMELVEILLNRGADVKSKNEVWSARMVHANFYIVRLVSIFHTETKYSTP